MKTRTIVPLLAVVLVVMPATLQAAGNSDSQATAAAPAQSAAGAPAAAPAEGARALLAKWMETEKIIARERQAWEHSRDMLRSRLELLQGEIAAQEQKTGALRADEADLAARQRTLAQEGASTQEGLTALLAWVGELESDVRRLSPTFPEPLLAKVRPLLQRMPADPARTQVSVAERFQNVAGILNEANRFNNDITLATEIRTLAGAAPSEVRVVYLGLGQAWFVSPSGEAGIGRPGADGWEWQTDASLAPKVAEVIEILQSKARPKLIDLPVSFR